MIPVEDIVELMKNEYVILSDEPQFITLRWDGDRWEVRGLDEPEYFTDFDQALIRFGAML